MTNEEIIKGIVRTEKSTQLSVDNRYVLQVAKAARKPQIAEAVEKKYGVHVLAVRTLNVKGETKYIRGTRRTRVTPVVKKAIVTLKPGERIEQV